eukprot:TRINITY_DN309_c1_g1_i2.p1 TRINITY_DN309_c1_g1~~TRINITY_DN309_c1_g1_i2.p1  ORF type:complete len:333 (+),score=41.73 TRINITY_DN309_c1_g1_i2:22-1020(+)
MNGVYAVDSTSSATAVWQNIYGEVISSTLFAIAMLIVHRHWYKLEFKIVSHQLLFIPVSFLLVFRCSNSYARYWEGRGLLGQLTFCTREINTKCVCYTTDKILASNIKRLSLCCMYLITLTVQTYWDKLSDSDFSYDYSKVEDLLTKKEWDHLTSLKSGQPLFVLMILRRYIAEASSRQVLTPLQGYEINQDISTLHTTWNAMLKITSTPLPYPWMHLTKVVLYLFVYSMVFPVISVLDWVGVPFIVVISFMLFGLAAIGQEMEDPFGDDVNDFDLSKIENNVVIDVENLFRKESEPQNNAPVQQPDPYAYRLMNDTSQTSWGVSSDERTIL